MLAVGLAAGVRADVQTTGKRQTSRVGTSGEAPVRLHKAIVVPELLFKADFEGTAEAAFAKGAAKPVQADDLSFAPGVDGQAVRLTHAAHARLEYAVKDNVDPVRGTVAMWVKREWNFGAAKQPWRTLFAFPWKGNAAGDRVGTGALWFWFCGTTLRADPSDDDDSRRTCELPADGEWTHLVCTWDEEGVGLFVNGRRRAGRGEGKSPMIEALRRTEFLSFSRSEFRRFSIGGRAGAEQADALIDDLRIYSAPLSAEAVKALWQERADKVQKPRPRMDYAKIFAADGTNSYEGPSVGVGGVPGELELVEEVTFDAGSLVRLGKGRVRTIGEHAFKRLKDEPYLELGAKEGSRAAFRFNIDTNAPLYCFEFDYPDDAKRTADLIVQPCRGDDYVLQVGVAAGDEYPNTGKILTHRCLYWSSVPDVAVVLMTARKGAPAALSAIRLFRVKSGRLPVAAVNEPPANADGWRRSVALYFEDPAVGLDFGLDPKVTGRAEGIGSLIDRTAALMKYTGENLFAYPGVWYDGLIGDDWNPRNHAPDYLLAWYEKFGQEGLGVIPTVNPNNLSVAPGLVTLETMTNGTLHASEIAIHDTGKPNWGRYHDTPPDFNFHHPKVQANIERSVDALLEQGKGYPAFKGICLHLTRHNMLWFGDETSGYNDYTVRAFAKDCGVRVPFETFKENPLRGKDYAAWLRANCWEQWLKWRCDQVTALYVRIAKKLAAARPDLKLWINSFVPADVKHPEFMRPDYMPRANWRCGLDGAALTQAAPNLILCQTLVPADYRRRHESGYPSQEARAHQRVMDALPGFYGLLKGADYPWVNQHDRYWETAIGRSGGSLSCDWMTECGWRVSTINPSGRNALRHFVQPLRHTDVLGLSKGGFLIGTYGMEDVLVPFVRAFRALPAVVMQECGRIGDVVMRQAPFDGKSYFYVVNTGEGPQRLKVAFPPGTVDLVSGKASGGGQMLELQPYELRAYAAPSGGPQIRLAFSNGTVGEYQEPVADGDFGRDAFGWLEARATEPGRYVIRLGEQRLPDGAVNVRPAGTIRGCAVTCEVDRAWTRVPLVPDQRNTTGVNGQAVAIRLPPDVGVVLPFRYVEQVSGPGALSFRRVFVHWPMACTVSCPVADADLRKIWDFCQYTMVATSFAGVMVDGDRERIPYEGDIYINMLGQLYGVDGNPELARKSIRHVLDYPTWPTEWKQHAIMCVWEDWRFTGSTALAADCYDRLRNEKLMLERARPDGLLPSSDEDIVDWPRGERDGYDMKTPCNSVVNAFHYRTLREMSDLARALGKTDDAQAFAARADRVRTRFNELFFDAKRGLYVDGEGSRHASLHANAAALDFGLVPADRQESVVAFLAARGMACSPYFAQYYLEALCKYGRKDVARRLMASTDDRSWLGMIRAGATMTMEAWSQKAKPNQDWNHAWGAVPLNILARFFKE